LVGAAEDVDIAAVATAASAAALDVRISTSGRARPSKPALELYEAAVAGT